MLEGLQADDVTAIGVGVIVVVIVLGFLLALVFTKIISRLVLLIVVAGLAFLVWQQRTNIENKVNSKTCDLNTTFFGIHVDADNDVVKLCNKQQ